jgi:pimeloyl-ACP methyl ester carboxylesterase
MTPPPSPPVIVVGFVGGTVKHDDPIRSEVKIAEHLRAEYAHGVFVETFENRRREKALHVILTQLGADRSGLLSENEKRRARIILYGHSWGGSAMVELARELDRSGIPVLLTVQIDSVKRFGADDSVIPPNVARAANFYQPNGVIHGRAEIRAADPAKTQILGNFRFDYKEKPIHCTEYPWYDRTFAKTHTEIDCDPAVWSRVEALIRQQISPEIIKPEAVKPKTMK